MSTVSNLRPGFRLVIEKLSLAAPVLMLAMAACSSQNTGVLQLADNGAKIPLNSSITQVSTQTAPQIPHSGCPANVKVVYQRGNETITRIYTGSTLGVGICDVTARYGKELRDVQSIMGLWLGKRVTDHIDANGPPMLKILQRDPNPAVPDTYTGFTSGDVSKVEFPCAPKTPGDVGDDHFMIRECSYRDRNLVGQIETTFDASWAQDPRDPEAWIPLGAGPSQKFEAVPGQPSIRVWHATNIEFLDRPPIQSTRRLALN